MSSFRRLLPYLKPYTGRFMQASLVMVCVAGLNGLMVWVLRPAINTIFEHRDMSQLPWVVAAIPAVFFLKMIFSYAQAYTMSWIGQRITRDIREELFRHLHELSMDYFWRAKSGEVLSRMTNDLTQLQSALQFVPLYVVRDSLTVLVLLGVMFYLHWQFAATALLVIPMIGAVLGILGRKLRSAGRRSQEVLGELTHRFQESLQGMLVVKSFNYEEGAIRKFNEDSAAFFDQMMRYFRATALSGPLMEFLGSTIMAAVVYQGGHAIFKQEMTPGDFFTFLGAFFAAYSPIKNLSQLNAQLQLGLASADRVFAVLDEKPSVVDKPNGRKLGKLTAGLVFENVSFKYPGRENWALRNVSLTVKPGEIVALAGPSGSGKTTFAHLLLRLFDPVEGRILLDGVDLREYSTASLRRQLGLVAQDTILFNDTLAGNLSVGRPEATRAEIESALETADAAGFVKQLPQGLDTALGDRGMRLSGGQRQRLAIARAVLKDPSVLLLDEATSNLDASSERAVQEALERLFPGRTVLLIAHRLATLQKADRIVVLHQGEIVESGTHEELLRQSGIYATLYRFQQLQPA